MEALVIEATGLRKRYAGRHRTAALDGLDLTVSAGSVHGLLGPEGAGKTTVVRTLLGLVRRDAGDVRILGRAVPSDLAAVMPRVGALVQGPRPRTSMSGRRHLELLARAAGVPGVRVAEVLEQVGLTGRRPTRLRDYSPGSHQRLALAAALLRTPDLLLLDEPTEGLDPTGTREIRALLRELAGQGVSMLVGSASLEEVQQVCDTVTVVDRGRALATGGVEDLVGGARTRTRVGTDAPERARALLEEAGFTVGRDADDLLVEGLDHRGRTGQPEQISRLLAAHEIFVSELSAVRPDLESVVDHLNAAEAPR